MTETDRGDSLNASIKRLHGINQVGIELSMRGEPVTLNIATEKYDQMVQAARSSETATPGTLVQDPGETPVM